ncbi:MAG TPA: ATP-binding protein [Dinghuibacter sp.]|uniref:ATP-binding protein n=1 Tax=Dinghuibacter sp. TaxID=2024697 RepID=UPI002C4CCC1D|nr:ATP-binding protein [Dinghuibacter sp.]HTJ11037.1 ATP-binding protein [Dinghuibacter sp.]
MMKYYILSLSLLVAACEARNPDNTAYFDPIFRQADSLERGGDGKAVAWLDSVFNNYPEAGPLDRYRRYDFLARHAGYTQHNYALASQYDDSMLEVSRPYADNPLFQNTYGLALLGKGQTLLSLGAYDEAFKYFFEGRNRYAGSCFLSSQYNEALGTIYYNQHKFPSAIRYYGAALSDLRGCASRTPYEQFTGIQGLLDNIGLAYGAMNANDSALYYFNHTLAYADSAAAVFTDPDQQQYIREVHALVNGNISTIFDQQGNYVAEEKAIRSSMMPRGNLFDNGVLSLADISLHHLGRPDEARALLDQARRSLNTEVHETGDELMWRRLDWQYWDTTGHTAEAYRAYRSYIGLRDSLRATQQNLSRIDVNREFDDLRRQQQLTELRENNVLQRDYLLIAIGFSTMAVIILALIWWNWRRSRRDVRVIGLHNKHLELTLDSLEQRNREYDYLFKMVAHDLRNPIAGISGITELLAESEGITSEERQMLALIRHSCSQVLGLIHDLLESKSNPETRRLTMQWCDMSDLLEECVSLLQVKAEEKRQQIKLAKTRSYPVLADRNKMWRVLNNLLTNAIKFSPEKSVIRVAATPRDNTLLISVTDTGIGIPEDMREKIFDAFGAGRSGTQGERSFGLGLSICRQIVEAHGGSIWFESETGRGTTFYVTLPMPVIVEEEVPA